MTDADHIASRRLGSFSDAVPPLRARRVREDSSDEEYIGFVPHNRGNKLKRKANSITGGTRLIVPELGGNAQNNNSITLTHNNNTNLANNSSSSISHHHNGSQSIDENEELQIRNFRNSVASRANGALGALGVGAGATATAGGVVKREVLQVRSVVGSAGAEELDGEELSDSENPYAGIKIGEILSPLETSTEILQRPQLRKLFHSPQLQIMAVHAMAMIEREKMVNKMMSRVALILQGDDPMYPQLGYGMGEGCSTALMGMPDQEEFVNGNKEWKKNGVDQPHVQQTLALLMENINCSNQYIDLLNESRDAVNYVSKQKKRLWKKLKEKRARQRARTQPRGNRGH
ncbi:MAG: hypothetical protein J3Q66DRAFT_337371 [Benniella sp.]|nr:MAG: hypothetical protein J3Q66DRAFT_337371 [Benniella sp.]